MGYGQYSENTQVRHNPLANTSKPAKRQKQVFDTDELPHLWAHRTQDSARNAQGNLYFADGVIYSYGDRFPIAAHVVNKRGQAAILFTTRTYSVTTSRHTRAVRRAIPSGTVRFDVALTSSMLPLRDGALDSATIIQAYRDEIRERIGNASAARMGKKIQEHLESARRELAELLRFVEFFGLPQMSERARIESRKLPHIPATVEEAKELGKAEKQEKAKFYREQHAAEYAERIEQWMLAHPDYATRWDGTNENAESLASEFRDAKNKRQVEAQRARLVAELAEWMAEHGEESAKWDGTFENGSELRKVWETADRERRNARALADWLSGQRVSSSILYTHDALLRIVGDTVETSRGARFPVSHAVRGLALVRAVMARGEEWRTNGHTCHLGHYRVDCITADGTVYAGCHVVPWSSIERIAPELDAMAARFSALEEAAQQ